MKRKGIGRSVLLVAALLTICISMPAHAAPGSSSSVSIEDAETVASLYLGATFYYAEYPLLDARGEVVDSVVVDLTVPVIVDFKELQVEIPIDEKELLQQQQMNRQEANALWDAIEEKVRMTETAPPKNSALSRGSGRISERCA